MLPSLTAAVLACCLTVIAWADPAPPNIVIILADDMGYSDIGCFGGEARTPNLDKLARHGVRFTQFYNTGRCCPTRASLLTGLYPHQAGVGHMTSDRGKPGYRGRLNDRCVTIAEVLRPAGYHTAAAGKWHVTPFSYHTGVGGDRDTWPLQRGFDRFVGSLAGGGNYYGPKGWMVDNQPAEPGEGFYYTDAVADAASTFVNQTPDDQPLFLYIAFTAPHWPLHALEDDIKKYRGVYDQGWDAVREARYQRMIEMGLVDERWALPPRDKRAKAWDEVGDQRAWRAAQMAAYAAMIDRMDQGIGRVVAALQRTGRFDNTLILFLSDNGGCEEDVRLPGIKRFATNDQDTSRWGNRPDVMPGPADTFQSYAIPWANASNTPYRWYKSEVHEGGIATPLIAHWPAGTAEQVAGTLNHRPGHVIDLMATCVAVSGATYPDTHRDTAVQPMQGVSLRGALRGEPIVREAPLYFEHEGNRAIRDGRWKLVKLRNGPWELYDLEADRTELNDLARRQTERVEMMKRQWQTWAEHANVLPAP
ncbi:MAG: arylsulfatase [Phycisphaeraceae bacterium]